MIARMWRGAVAAEDRQAYADYMHRTGIPGYADVPGNRGVWMLRRDLGDRVEFVMFSLWDSLEAVAKFAGERYEQAVFYPEDDRFLVERDEMVRHFEVAEHVPTLLPDPCMRASSATLPGSLALADGPPTHRLPGGWLVNGPGPPAHAGPGSRPSWR